MAANEINVMYVFLMTEDTRYKYFTIYKSTKHIRTRFLLNDTKCL